MKDNSHSTAAHATTANPTLSLLRVSAFERLVGAGIILVVLWVLVFSVLA